MTVNPTFLRDLDLMHESLQKRLLSALNVTDLLPFLHKLCDHSELKQSLSLLLRKQYQNTCDEANNNESLSSNVIRSLFIETHQLCGIPSDDIHEHIISYLPSSDYKWIPSISKHFNEIVKRNANIYNEKKYEISVYEYDNDDNISKWKMKLNHFNKSVYITASNNHNKQSTFNQIPSPYNHIKIWRLRNSDNFTTATDIKSYALHLLMQNKDCIHCLIISLPLSQSYADTLFNIHFKNICCLDISYNRDLNIQTFADSAIFKCIQILSFDSVSMECIINLLNIIHRYRSLIYLSIKNIQRTMHCVPLRIPQSVEWLHLDRTVSLIPIDLTQCNTLIGMSMNQEIVENIMWNQQYIIPYAKINYATDDEPLRYYQIRFLTYRTGISCAQFPSLSYTQSGEIETYSLDQMCLNNMNENDKCLLLDVEEADNISFFDKLMRFVIPNEECRNKRIVKYKRLDALYNGYWIKNICLRGHRFS